MWTYRQSTGELLRDGARVAVGYSGDPSHKNKPEDDHLANQGPIPRGRYKIGEVLTITGKGEVCIDLHPFPGQDLHGRGGFLIHGDSIKRPGTASHGCIILARKVRDKIVASADRVLEVVR